LPYLSILISIWKWDKIERRKNNYLKIWKMNVMCFMSRQSTVVVLINIVFNMNKLCLSMTNKFFNEYWCMHFHFIFEWKYYFCRVCESSNSETLGEFDHTRLLAHIFIAVQLVLLVKKKAFFIGFAIGLRSFW
jgi:hypothetical protein